MKRRQFTLGGLGLALAGAARAQDAPPSEPATPTPVPAPAAPGDLIGPILTETKAPALGGAVFNREGVVWLEAAGRRRAGREDPVTPGDLWHIGSNTKAMTAALYARLVEQGKAKWGATLPELFPDLKLNPAWTTTTVEQVMSHRAGITDRTLIDIVWLNSARTDPRPLPAQRRALAAKALRAAPAGKPGSFEYANANFIIVGAAIEQITGEAWEDVITAQLFQPLDMQSAGFGAPTGDQPWGHTREGVPVDPSGVADNPAALGPAGTAHLSLADYGKFLRLFLSDGGGVLNADSLARLTAPAEPGDVGHALGWGVLTNRSWAQGPLLTHDGSNTLWYVTALIAPKRGLAIVGASNDGARGARATQTLAFRLRERFSPA